MRKYKAGQKVRVKQSLENGKNGASSGMESFRGKVVTLKKHFCSYSPSYRGKGWSVKENIYWFHEDDLEPLSDINDPQEGMVVVSEHGVYRTVLGRVGSAIFTSTGTIYKDNVSGMSPFSITGWKELVMNNGYRLVEEPPEPEQVEITIDEIAEKFGIAPEQVRVKKED